MRIVAPSVLAADFLHLESDVRIIDGYADMFHLDIMDGVFVPNISYGFPVVEAIGSVAQKPMDAHLMIVDPEKYIPRFAKAGVRMLSFHLNATQDPAGALGLVRECGMKAGLAINPDFPVSALFPFLQDCDYVVLMSVFAGFGGQKFIEETYGRLVELKAEVERRGADCLIEVDGGVSPSNSERLWECGADILVAGSAVFKAADPAVVISSIRGI